MQIWIDFEFQYSAYEKWYQKSSERILNPEQPAYKIFFFVSFVVLGVLCVPKNAGTQSAQREHKEHKEINSYLLFHFWSLSPFFFVSFVVLCVLCVPKNSRYTKCTKGAQRTQIDQFLFAVSLLEFVPLFIPCSLFFVSFVVLCVF